MRTHHAAAAALIVMIGASRVQAQSDTARGEAARTIAQSSAAELIARGDAEYAALKPDAALALYESALAADSLNYEALWKAARGSVDLGESAKDDARRTNLYRAGERYARRAINLRPSDAEGHFNLARALGRLALSVGVRERVRYATAVRESAVEALRHDPKHPGALHVLGVWNAEVMRLNGVQRFFAKNVLGGRVFGTASWTNAISYMEQAVAVDPDRLTHRLDLAKIYADVGDKAKAREQFEAVIQGTVRDFNDPLYKREAEEGLRKLK